MSTEPKADYDSRLLQGAPEASRAAKQEGYNVDILTQTGHRTPPSITPLPSTTPAPVYVNGTSGSNHPLHDFTSSPRPRPWYRTPRGIALLVIAVIAILGAIVGGAVGGTVGKHHSSDAVIPPSSTASPSSTTPNSGNGIGQGQSTDAVGVGPAPSTSATVLDIAGQISSIAQPTPRVRARSRERHGLR